MEKNKMKVIIAAFGLVLAFSTPVFAQKIGTVLGSYYSTDIKAFINNKEIKSYNVGGTTLIPIEALKENGFDISWNPNTREVKANTELLSVEEMLKNDFYFYEETEKIEKVPDFGNIFCIKPTNFSNKKIDYDKLIELAEYQYTYKPIGVDSTDVGFTLENLNQYTRLLEEIGYTRAFFDEGYLFGPIKATRYEKNNTFISFSVGRPDAIFRISYGIVN